MADMPAPDLPDPRSCEGLGRARLFSSFLMGGFDSSSHRRADGRQLDHARMHPNALGRGPELRRQLACAAIRAVGAVRDVAPGARFIQAEPLSHVAGHPDMRYGRPMLVSETGAEGGNGAGWLRSAAVAAVNTTGL